MFFSTDQLLTFLLVKSEPVTQIRCPASPGFSGGCRQRMNHFATVTYQTICGFSPFFIHISHKVNISCFPAFSLVSSQRRATTKSPPNGFGQPALASPHSLAQPTMENTSCILGDFIGGITLTGSLIAFGKLNGNLSALAVRVRKGWWLLPRKGDDIKDGFLELKRGQENMFLLCTFEKNELKFLKRRLM